MEEETKNENDPIIYFLAEVMLIAESIKEDYIKTISELTGVSTDDVRKRISESTPFMKEKIRLKLKKYQDQSH